MNVFELVFFEVGVDVDCLEWNYCYYCCVSCDVLVDLDLVIGDDVVDWGMDYCVG